MTERKTFKRRVRDRMEKTGERYTAARRHVVEETAAPEPSAEGMVSEAAVQGATGRGWGEWYEILDAWGAAERTHKEIARHLQEEHGVSGWWAQSVTVGYERARGRRAKHQTASGWTIGASVTVPVPVTELWEAFTNEERRAAWLPGAVLRERTSRPPRGARYDFGDGTTRLVADFTDKGERSTVTIAHERLPSAEEAERMKAFWRERLAALKSALS